MEFMNNLLMSLGNMGQGIDSAMTGAANPFGLAPPQGMSPEMAGRMPYLDLGMGMLANSTQRPLQALGSSFQNMKQQGMDMGGKRLWAQQVQSQMQDAQEERENKKRMAAQLQALIQGGGQPSAAPMDAAGTPPMQPGATPDMPQMAQQVFNPTQAQPVPQPMEQQGGGMGQFTPQQKFQAQYWLSAGNPQKAMEALFKQGDPTNWQTVTTEGGVFAFNPETRQMEKLGERPTRNEGEGRGFTEENTLRESYMKQSKPFTDLRVNYQRIQAAAQDNTGASDIAMVYSFMKMLDPTSVVREGEFATAQNAGGVDSQIIGMYNKLLTGERLAPQVREDFVQQSGRQFEQQMQSYGETRKMYQGLASQYGLNPERVAPDITFGVQMQGNKRGSNAPDAGWTTLPNGARIRLKN